MPAAPPKPPARPSPARSRPPTSGPEAARLRVLLVHNRYQQPGGEDRVFEAEHRLLAERGHDVRRYEAHNDDVATMSKLRVLGRTFWSPEAYRDLAEMAQDVDVVHFHNTLPLVSPAGYYAVRKAGAAVVQTLHNFRLVCPGALLYRDGAPCHDCVGKALPLPGVAHGCYRDSRVQTGVVGAMTAAHRAAGTYHRIIDRYVVLSPFAREQFLKGGLPADKLAVKPNFLREDPGAGDGAGGYVLYVGRLSDEKGVRPLLDAWHRHPDLPPLVVVGDGPLADRVASAAERLPHVSWRGWQERDAVLKLMKGAALTAVPSTCYEGWPLSAVESFAVGTPVAASAHGSLLDMITLGMNGALFTPGDPDALAAAVRTTLADPDGLQSLRAGARATYERALTAEVNYARLIQIYAAAVAERARS